MNVFILCTGRCGSTAFIEACQHITNFSSAHESRRHIVGPERIMYPPNHIEADNRLSWFLGRLEEKYGDSPFYVHLRRNDLATAKSYAKRRIGIIPAYRDGVFIDVPPEVDGLAVALDYVETVNTNIEFFLRTKSKKMNVNLESIKEDFVRFWERIGAEGDRSAALAEFDVRHNASPKEPSKARRRYQKARRVIKALPEFLRDA